MIKIYHSNDLDVLQSLLANIMDANPCGVFEKEAILVQSQGMAHWLKLKLADHVGIAAQLDFPLPSSFIWRILNTLFEDLPERSFFDKQIMHWSLLKLLPDCMNHPVCEPLMRYGDTPIKRYQLAFHIADTFDQYLVYRPDWLLDWQQGRDVIEHENMADNAALADQLWQPHLWRALVEHAQSLGVSALHRASLLYDLAEQDLQSPKFERAFEQLPKRLFVFGIAALPKSYWTVLQVLSKKIDVHFFLLNPCKNYWGDIADESQRKQWLQTFGQQGSDAVDNLGYLDRGNPLLASWGRLGRDFLNLINQSPADMQHEIEGFVEREPTHLLGYLQRDIFELNDRSAIDYGAPIAVEPDDDSIRLVSAHSPLREVQHVHDQLWQWFERNPELEPDDVLVMVPNIDQYAPYFETVFAAVDGDTSQAKTYLPWALADQSLMGEDPIGEAFLALLELPDSLLNVSDVMGFLDVACVRDAFAIESDQLELIATWCENAQIRWGIDDAHHQSMADVAFEQNSWHKGLRQLLLGLMLPPEGEQKASVQGDWAAFGVGVQEAPLLGRLVQFIDALNQVRQRFMVAYSPDLWLEHLNALCDTFFGHEDNAAQTRIRHAIEQLGELWQHAHFEHPLEREQVHAWLADKLGQQTGWQRFMTGRINVCTLMPMRSIPFKVICLLGMNDSDYPRSVRPHSFDLIHSTQAQLGDRSRREDDRYLFLEAVLSAQMNLYISYRGHHVRDNSELQPCVLVSECIDYLTAGFCLKGHESLPSDARADRMKTWLLEHLPLQAFGDDNYQTPTTPDKASKPAVVSVNTLWAHVAAQQSLQRECTPYLSSPLALPDEVDSSALAWAAVKQAFIKPLEFFFTQRLGVNVNPAVTLRADDEPFTLEGLGHFQLKDEAWQHLIQKGASSDFYQRQAALGNLPPLGAGELSFEQLYQQVEQLKAHVSELGDMSTVETQYAHLTMSYDANLLPCAPFTWQRVTVNHTLSVLGRHIINVRVGQLRPIDYLNTWFDLVFAVASGLHVEGAYGAGLNRYGKVESVQFVAPTHDEALTQVHWLAHRYWNTWCLPQTTLPQASFLFESNPKMDWAAALKDSYELDDAYFKRVYPDAYHVLEASSSFIDANHMWLPALLDAMKRT